MSTRPAGLDLPNLRASIIVRNTDDGREWAVMTTNARDDRLRRNVDRTIAQQDDGYTYLGIRLNHLSDLYTIEQVEAFQVEMNADVEREHARITRLDAVYADLRATGTATVTGEERQRDVAYLRNCAKRDGVKVSQSTTDGVTTVTVTR